MPVPEGFSTAGKSLGGATDPATMGTGREVRNPPETIIGERKISDIYLKEGKMKTIVCALATAALLIPTVSAYALDLTDYVDPDLYYQDAELRATFNFKEGNQDQSSYNGTGEFTYDMEYSTLPFKWLVYADVQADLSRGPRDEDETAENYILDAWTEAKKYRKGGDELFYFGRFDFDYQDLEGSDYENHDREEITAGVGYGRVITATPLMEAVRCVDDLTKYGIIQGEVPDEAYLQLASVIAKEQEYKSKYSLKEYEKFWYEAMEQVLRDAGVLANDTLGAMGVIRIQDILTDERVLTRKHGWEATAGLGYLINDFSGNDGDPLFRASFEYTRPYGFKWQLIERVTYATILADWEFGDTDHNFNNTVSLGYEISDMIDWINTWELDIILASDSGKDDTYRNGLQSELRFYITNTIDLITRLRFDHLDAGDNEDDDVVTTLYMGIAYTIF